MTALLLKPSRRCHRNSLTRHHCWQFGLAFSRNTSTLTNDTHALELRWNNFSNKWCREHKTSSHAHCRVLPPGEFNIISQNHSPSISESFHYNRFAVTLLSYKVTTTHSWPKTIPQQYFNSFRHNEPQLGHAWPMLHIMAVVCHNMFCSAVNPVTTEWVACYVTPPMSSQF